MAANKLFMHNSYTSVVDMNRVNTVYSFQVLTHVYIL